MVEEVVKVKKVTLSVKYFDSNGNFGFAELFVGVMDSRSIYAKQTSYVENNSTPIYVKIDRRNIKLDQSVRTIYDVLGVTHYSIFVPDKLNLFVPVIILKNDPRITLMNGDEDIIAEIEKFDTERMQIFKRISS